jgi:hypothetical protein
MTVIFGNPSSTELPFLRDMPPDFRHVLALHARSRGWLGHWKWHHSASAVEKLPQRFSSRSRCKFQ